MEGKEEEKEKKGGVHTSNPTTVEQYFKYYSKLSNQQNMMQDYVRTGHYFDAITKNANDFKDKVVMDVGSGSGILSLFAAKSGAKQVFAVEASNVAQAAKLLAENNGLSHVIQAIQSCIEDIHNPAIEKNVDVLISEPLGTMLFNERMLETYIIARDLFLKPGGKMFPCEAYLCVAPFYDEKVYSEQLNKTNFWNSTAFYGFDLSCLKKKAVEEKLRQPIIETYDPKTHLALEARHKVDFMTCKVEDLQDVDFDFSFKIIKVGIIHGIGAWFDAYFCGSQQFVVLTTSPSSSPTHWYQMRFLLPHPIAVNPGQTVVGNLKLKANKEQSFDMKLTICIPELNITSTGEYDLKDPDYRWNSGYQQSTNSYGYGY